MPLSDRCSECNGQFDFFCPLFSAHFSIFSIQGDIHNVTNDVITLSGFALSSMRTYAPFGHALIQAPQGIKVSATLLFACLSTPVRFHVFLYGAELISQALSFGPVPDKAAAPPVP